MFGVIAAVAEQAAVRGSPTSEAHSGASGAGGRHAGRGRGTTSGSTRGRPWSRGTSRSSSPGRSSRGHSPTATRPTTCRRTSSPRMRRRRTPPPCAHAETRPLPPRPSGRAAALGRGRWRRPRGPRAGGGRWDPLGGEGPHPTSGGGLVLAREREVRLRVSLGPSASFLDHVMSTVRRAEGRACRGKSGIHGVRGASGDVRALEPCFPARSRPPRPAVHLRHSDVSDDLGHPTKPCQPCIAAGKRLDGAARAGAAGRTAPRKPENPPYTPLLRPLPPPGSREVGGCGEEWDTADPAPPPGRLNRRQAIRDGGNGRSTGPATSCTPHTAPLGPGEGRRQFLRRAARNHDSTVPKPRQGERGWGRKGNNEKNRQRRCMPSLQRGLEKRERSEGLPPPLSPPGPR